MSEGGKNILWGVIAGLIVAAISYGISSYDIVKKVDKMTEIQGNHGKMLKEIHQTLVSKDQDGIEVLIGVSNDLKGVNVSVVKGNRLGLKYGETIFLTNVANTYFPTNRLIVTREAPEQQKNGSSAEIFISYDAAKMLGIGEDDWFQGVYRINLKKAPKDGGEQIKAQ